MNNEVDDAHELLEMLQYVTLFVVLPAFGMVSS